MRTSRKYKAIFSVMLAMGATSVHAETLKLPSSNNKIEIDGVMSDGEWGNALKIPMNINTSPGNNTPAPFETTAYAIESDTHLYVAFVADHPDVGSLIANYRDRDTIYHDDFIGVKLDTFNDEQFAYKFLANARGVQMDGIDNETTGDRSMSWDGLWQSNGQVNDTCYVVEMAIPYSLLNFDNAEGQKVLGIEFLRLAPMSEASYRLSNVPMDRNDPCGACQMADIEGFSRAESGNALVVTPSVVAIHNESRDIYAPSSEFDGDTNVDVGLDVKWGITDSSTLNFTLNPDFSTIEADAGQLSVNNTFSLYYEEKRSFFLENSSYFSSAMDLVYTRNIAQPDYGIKYTDRSSEHTFGVFFVEDSEANVLLPGNLGSDIVSVGDSSINGAVRYTNSVMDYVTYGVMGTIREADEYHNYVVGVDGSWQISDADQATVQFMQSETVYPESVYNDTCDDSWCYEPVLRTLSDSPLSDHAYKIEFTKEGESWNGHLRHESYGEDFRADLGYIPAVDQDIYSAGLGHTWYLDSAWSTVGVSGSATHKETIAGDTIETIKGVSGYVEGPYLSFIEVGFKKGRQSGLRLDPTKLDIVGNTDMFDISEAFMYAEFYPVSWASVSLWSTLSETIDYANNLPADAILYNPSVTVRPNEHIEFNISHTFNELETERGRAYTANLTDVRLSFHYDLRHSLKMSAVYSDIDRETENYNFAVDETSRDLGLQLTYSYKVDPQTGFYLGYSDMRFEDDELMRMRQSERTLYAKVTYAFSL